MYKRFICWFIIFLFILSGIVCSIVYKLDPLYVYKFKKNDYFYATERYQMPGLIKHMDYDTLFVGTSMGRNFLEPDANKLLHTTSFNGSLPGSTAREQNMTAQLATHSKTVKNIIWELNLYSFSGKPEWVSEGASPFPTYMYDTNKLNDIQYLISPYSRKIALQNMKLKLDPTKSPQDPHWLYKFGDDEPNFSVDIAKRVVDGTPHQSISDGWYHEQMLKSFDSNIIEFVKQNPEVQFTFFYAPYPVTYHVVMDKNDSKHTKENMLFKKEVYTKLAQLKSVKLYDFQDQKEVTYNLSNYMSDQTHYYRYINDWIVKQLATTEPITNKRDYEQRLTNFSNEIRNFDTSKLVNSDERPK